MFYLKDFDALVDGLPDSDAVLKRIFLQSATVSRAQAELMMGKSGEAMQEALALSLNSVFVEAVTRTLTKLPDELEAARRYDDIFWPDIHLRRMLQLIRYLDDYLNSIRPTEKNASRIYYNAAVAAAVAQRAASTLADDASGRKILLIKARDRLLALQGGEMRALYLAQPEIQSQIKLKTLDPADPDPWVALSLAFTYHDLGDDKAARALFLPLFARHAIVPKFTHLAVDGQISVNINDPYWEAVYVLLAQSSDPITTKGRAQ